MYDIDNMGVYHEDSEHPPSCEEEPPGHRDSIQSDGTGRLFNGSMRSHSIGHGNNIGRIHLVYFPQHVGSKPYFGLHNYQAIPEDDEENHKRKVDGII